MCVAVDGGVGGRQPQAGFCGARSPMTVPRPGAVPSRLLRFLFSLQTCNGAVACQLMDCLHPGTVNMKKVQKRVVLGTVDGGPV